MAGLLEKTARRWASSPCSPYPCAAEVWAYASSVAGVPVADLPAHETRKQACELLRSKGGIEAYARSLIEPIGWRETSEPKRGDIGLVTFAGLGKTCAICLGDRWMARGDCRAISGAPLQVHNCWSFG